MNIPKKSNLNWIGRCAVGLALFCVPGLCSTGTLITFDDLSAGVGGVQIANGYAGLNWSNFYALDGPSYGGGYAAGVISSPNVAYNGFGAPASFSSPAPFTLDSLYLTAAWNDNLQVTVTGLNNGQAIAGDTATLTLSATQPTLFAPGWSGLTEVDFTSFGGTPHPGYEGGGDHFALDNLAIDATPEPSFTWAGLGLLGALGLFKLRFRASS